jgi:hypothetical protein
VVDPGAPPGPSDAADLTAYATAAAARDPDALAAACAEGVVFNSPITSSVRFEGRQEFAELVRTVFEVYDDFEVVGEHSDGDVRVIHFHAKVGSQELDEVQLLRLDDSGKIREITMFVRPLPGLTTLTAALGPRLARKRARWRAVMVAALSRPLAFMTRAGDRTGTRLISARRTRP